MSKINVTAPALPPRLEAIGACVYWLAAVRADLESMERAGAESVDSANYLKGALSHLREAEKAAEAAGMNRRYSWPDDAGPV